MEIYTIAGDTLATILKIPICNIIICEDIAVNEDNKLFIFNPFTGTNTKNIKKFYTYTIIQGIPNGRNEFKIQIVSPTERIIMETGDYSIMVEENIIRAKTLWSNINFYEYGEYTFKVLIKCNNEYELIGSSYICII